MKRIMRVVLPLLIAVGGIAAAGMLINARPQAAVIEVPNPVLSVEVMRAASTDAEVVVEAMGVVRAQRQVVLQPEVTGRVLQTNERLVPGGQLAAGENLVRIDRRDYSDAVIAGLATLEQARLRAREEASLRQVAEHEWRDASGVSDDARKFALRQPHEEAAKANVQSAQRSVTKARRNLRKTGVEAPFDAVVLEENVEVGQLVGPQTPLATLAGTDRFWVQISVPVSHLGFVQIPGVNLADPQGSSATVIDEIAGEAATPRDGYVERLLTAVDERGRMAQLIIAVEDPLGLKLEPAQRPLPLLIGTYVRVQISGRTLKGVFAVPREAMRDDTHAWIVDDDSRLRARPVEVVWRERQRVLIKSGLEPGERVVTTPLGALTDGTKVQVTGQTAGADDSRDRVTAPSG